MVVEAAINRQRVNGPWTRAFGGAIGNVLEGYDFAAYGYFAAVFARNFFPSTDPVASLLSAFAVFAVAFFMRPLGGILFGHIADRHGRGRSLLISTTLMGCSTLLIGFLPTTAAAGLWAPVLLVTLRAIQGLSLGGEYAASITFLAEGSQPRRRGLIGSLAPASITLGALIGSCIGVLISALLTDAEIVAWGWRLPFFLSLALWACVLWLRRSWLAARLSESHPPSFPLLEALRTDWRPMLRAFLLSCTLMSYFYLMFVYFVTFMQQVDRLTPNQAFQINTASLLVAIALMVVFGAVSDRWGRRTLMVVSVAAMLCLTWPLFRLLSSHHLMLKILVGQMGFAVLVGAYVGGLPAAMAESFVGRTRCTAVALSYNLAAAVAGGTAPMIAAALIDPHARHPMGPAIYLMVWAAVSLIASLTLRESATKPLPP